MRQECVSERGPAAPGAAPHLIRLVSAGAGPLSSRPETIADDDGQLTHQQCPGGGDLQFQNVHVRLAF